MAFDLAFVDQVSASPTFRLDLNNKTPLSTQVDGTDFGMPELRKARSSTLLTDGDYISASAYGNRVLTLRIDLPSDKDQAATWFQKIVREVNREVNILRYKAGTTDPVFFRTFRSDIASVEWDGVMSFCTVTVEAEPFAVGLKESLPAVTVYNDPNDGLTLNANPFFETDVANWSNAQGLSSVVRTTSVSHEGVASMQITPDGTTANPRVQSEAIASAAGITYTISGWLRSNSGTPTVNLQVQWLDAGLASLGFAGTNITLPSTTWTFVSTNVTAPASTAFVRLVMFYAGTPTVANVVQLDEMRIRRSGSNGALYFEITNIRGDVEAPLFLQIGSSAFSGITVTRRMVIGARRRGTPSAGMPFVIQAEAMTLGTDTTFPGNDTTASGSGSNYARVATWTNPLLAPRLTIDPYPAAAGVDVRGTYRVFGRFRGSPAGAGGALAQLRWGVFGNTILNDAVPLTDVTNTAWDIVDLGLVQYPLGTDPGTDGLSNADLAARGMRIELAVSKGATTTNVDIDYLVLVPADDQFAVVGLQRDTTATAAVLDPVRRIAYMVGASGEVRSTTGSPLSIAGLLPSARVDGAINRFVVLLDINTQTLGDLITDTTTITPYYWPLYLFTRPVGS